MDSAVVNVVVFAPCILIAWLANQANRRRTGPSGIAFARGAFAPVLVIYGSIWVIGILLQS